ncbi:PIG-L deacetylase family protein [Altererythrobacter sp. Root672]|uniref:PIG-L deacetylase family protein n=1 Tax=Altererythrobacter sp. Root672 TaxID=1736584 RepID=UPI0006FE637E|nr:PIG-L deacetylase family protein [Altererythrobacter sp. Root672]KRA83614.1 GlcNAc-PI de-N-acetylase [Altererythrobacter sp. Root672]
MGELKHLGRVLVIAPHPDDEILGCGGTMARLAAEGHDVHVAIATQGYPPAFSEESVAQVRREMTNAHEIVRVTKTHVLDLPAAALDQVPASELNARLGRLVEEVEPDTLFLPFVGDIHGDHQLIFLASMVAARPRHDKAPSRIFCYETLSETNWYAAPITPAFVPNVFVDIADTLQVKLDAFAAFESQVRRFPEERSIEAIEALARVRGAAVHLRAAEGFMLIREIARKA